MKSKNDKLNTNQKNFKMKRIISLLLVAMLTMNLMQVNNVSYAKELGEDGVTTTERNAEATNSIESEDLVISSTNAIGSMLETELTEVTEEQEQNNGYNVFAIEVEGTTATVEYEAVEDCQLLVSIYDNGGIQMLGSGKVDVLATETETTVTIDIDSMPTYFYIRAYLIETDTLVPLCQEYNSELYTQTMQEFLAKTPEDFDSEKVLEIEEETNSFVVFSETTKIIPYNADYNTIEQMDETNKEYVIANPDENFSALQVGDVFSYEYEDGQVLIVDIATIENQEGKLVITGNEADMNEVFDYVRIDTDFSVEDSTVDPSTCDEEVNYLGRTNGEEEAASVEVPEANTAVVGYETPNAVKNTSGGAEVEIGDTYEVGKKDSKGNPQGFYGSIEFKATGELKVYRATGAEYIELSLTLTVDGTVQFTKKIDKSLKLGCLQFSLAPGVYIELVPQIKFKAEGALTYNAKVEFVIGVRGSKDGIKDITRKPTVEHNLKMEGKVYIGLSLSPRLKIVNDNLLKISFDATAGVEFQLENQEIVTNEKKGIKHDCTDCFEGDVRFKLDLSAELQFLDIDWFSFKMNVVNSDTKISDLYSSLTYGEFGFKKCPHVKYRVTAKAVDASKLPLEGVTIYGDYMTGENGKVEFYLKRDKYYATVEKAGYVYAFNGTVLNRFVVKDKEQQLYFMLLPDFGEKTIDSTTFPDANFRQYVLDEIDKDGNEKLSQTEIMDVTMIYVQGYNISDLSGVEVFTELQTLSASYNDLTFLDVSKNKKLEYLDCISNDLMSLDISKNIQLKWLRCGANDLTCLDVSNNTELEILWCCYNALTSLDLSGNTQLQELECFGNTLTFLNVSKNKQLRTLKCHTNDLTSLDVSNNTELETLWCSYNALTSLDVSNNTKLTSLSCDDDVEIIGYNVASVSTASLDKSVEIPEPTMNTTSVDTNNDGNVSSEQLQEKNWIISTATDTKNTYSGLYPDETYNFYVFKDAPTDVPFDSVFTENNLLYVKQYTSDANGSLALEYAPADDNTDAIEILVCAQKIDIADGYEVCVDDLTYDGEEQTPTVTLCVQNTTLEEGKDFRIEGDIIVSEVGEYTLTLVGIGKYTGELEVTFSVIQNVVPVTSIVLNQSTLKLLVGDKSVLSAIVTPNDASATSLNWASSNLSVVMVDAMGNVIAVGEGTADIVVTATDGSGVTATCKVTVEKKQEQPTGTDNPTMETSNLSTETDKLPTVGTKTTVSSGQYLIVASSTETKEVAFVKPKNNKKKTVTIPATVTIDGYKYNVISIADKAFKNNKKLQSITIGKNVKSIGKEAFSGCKKLKKITIKSSKLKSVGKNAIKGIDKKATIKVPKKQLKKYKKLFKSKTGYKKTMKIKK